MNDEPKVHLTVHIEVEDPNDQNSVKVYITTEVRDDEKEECTKKDNQEINQ